MLVAKTRVIGEIITITIERANVREFDIFITRTTYHTGVKVACVAERERERERTAFCPLAR